MFFQLVCILAASVQCGLTQNMPTQEVKSICGEDSILKCKAICKPGVQYRAVRWYKLGEEPSNKESGLLMKRLSPNSTTLWYAGLEREVELLADDSFDILLPNVTAVDSGRYKCLLAAPVGEQNQVGQVHLRVTGCLESTDQSEERDTILVLSIVGLVAALLIFTISYAAKQQYSQARASVLQQRVPVCSIYTPVMRKEQGLVKGPRDLSPNKELQEREKE